jgi:pathogenesis-related protein 1
MKLSSNTYKREILGENLYRSKGGIGISGKEITIAWYKEEYNYDFKSHNSKNGKISSHFTQLVWKETKEIGCGAKCFQSFCACTCNYYPAGNSIGLYDTNVYPYKEPIDE